MRTLLDVDAKQDLLKYFGKYFEGGTQLFTHKNIYSILK